MVEKIFIFSLSLVSVFGWTQQNPLRQKIDSIAQKKWDSTSVSLDSLDSPKLVELNLKKKDTVLVKERIRQDEIPVTPFKMMQSVKEQQWYFYGQNNLIFNQSSFSNWNTGGNNSIGVIGRVNYSLSYKKNRHFWDNNVQLGYGMVSITGQELRKTEDYIRVSSNYGYDLGHQYYLSTGFQFLSQFSAGYVYSSTQRVTFDDRISRFMAPAYVNFGIGILYNPSENFQVIVRPANAKLTFVLDKHLQQKGRYGLDRDGQSFRMELGAMLNALYRIKIYRDINLVNQITLFSNYTNHPERVDIAYNATLTMRFNRWISTSLNLDLIYDHDQIQKVQMKQVLGVGVSYNLGIENKPKNNKKDKLKPFF